ncbi:hypothetical protein Vlu01_20450 [Micromonospora lutea]|uniref:Uncharacterized protein n=1 Tax=Micromonospora lutea TaxID=419825 RepID=A0ABQ4IU18_9ACTN|nr:hypothetical protein Vlu01_20450 [Micromonospora lutea]
MTGVAGATAAQSQPSGAPSTPITSTAAPKTATRPGPPGRPVVGSVDDTASVLGGIVDPVVASVVGCSAGGLTGSVDDGGRAADGRAGGSAAGVVGLTR